MFNLESFAVLIILLPGFLTKKIIDGLVIREKPSAVKEITEALLFSLVIYSFLLITSYFLPFLKMFTLKTIAEKEFPKIIANINFGNVLFLLIGSVILGLGFVKIVHEGWYYRLLRNKKFTFTNRTGRIDVWTDVFTEHRKKWILVTLEDGAKILGWPDFYSENPLKRELFIADATITYNDGNKKDIKGPGVLLTEKVI